MLVRPDNQWTFSHQGHMVEPIFTTVVDEIWYTKMDYIKISAFVGWTIPLMSHWARLLTICIMQGQLYGISCTRKEERSKSNAKANTVCGLSLYMPFSGR